MSYPLVWVVVVACDLSFSSCGDLGNNNSCVMLVSYKSDRYLLRTLFKFCAGSWGIKEYDAKPCLQGAQLELLLYSFSFVLSDSLCSFILSLVS